MAKESNSYSASKGRKPAAVASPDAVAVAAVATDPLIKDPETPAAEPEVAAETKTQDPIAVTAPESKDVPSPKTEVK